MKGYHHFTKEETEFIKQYCEELGAKIKLII